MLVPGVLGGWACTLGPCMLVPGVLGGWACTLGPCMLQAKDQESQAPAPGKAPTCSTPLSSCPKGEATEVLALVASSAVSSLMRASPFFSVSSFCHSAWLSAAFRCLNLKTCMGGGQGWGGEGVCATWPASYLQQALVFCARTCRGG
jgi:hypothetical protein